MLDFRFLWLLNLHLLFLSVLLFLVWVELLLRIEFLLSSFLVVGLFISSLAHSLFKSLGVLGLGGGLLILLSGLLGLGDGKLILVCIILLLSLVIIFSLVITVALI